MRRAFLFLETRAEPIPVSSAWAVAVGNHETQDRKSR